MNDWNHLEDQLRSWKPRPPSPGVKRRLFAQPAPAEPHPAVLAWATVVRWLTPLSAGVTFAFMVFHQHSSALLPLSSPASTATLAVAAMSNEFYAAYLPANSHSQRNLSPQPRLGWTNSGPFRSSMASFPRLGTNELR